MNEKKKHFPIALIVIIIGAAIFLSGLIFYFVSGNKYKLDPNDLENIDTSFDAGEVQKLDFELAVGEFNIKTANTDKITVKAENIPKETVNIEVSGNTFKIESNEEKGYKNMFFGKFWGNAPKNNRKFDIIIPEKTYEDMNIDCGVGEFVFENLTCEKSDIDCGVGNVEFIGLNVDNLELDGGVGEIKITDSALGRSDIDTGVGEINFQGKILGDTDISIGVGYAKFDIDGFRNDYQIDTDGMADINCDINYSDNSSENHRKIQIDLDTGVGKADFNFK